MTVEIICFIDLFSEHLNRNICEDLLFLDWLHSGLVKFLKHQPTQQGFEVTVI